EEMVARPPLFLHLRATRAHAVITFPRTSLRGTKCRSNPGAELAAWIASSLRSSQGRRLAGALPRPHMLGKDRAMGLLVDGKWVAKDRETSATGGRFERQATTFRNWITPDGSADPTGTGGFKAEPGRYHLYVSLACPWAHRALIFRALKGLEPAISVSVTHWL